MGGLVSCKAKPKVKERFSSYAQGFSIKKGLQSSEIHFTHKISTLPTKKVRRIISLSNTVIPYLYALDYLDKLIASTELQYIHSPKYQQILNQNKCINLGTDPQVNLEQLIDLQPDIVFLSCNYQYHWIEKLESMNIPVFCLDEFQEQDPLGPAEWIKCIGHIIGKNSLATQLFSRIENEYLNTKKQLNQDTLSSFYYIAGEDIQGQWLSPHFQSYVCQLFADAGGINILEDLSKERNSSLTWEKILQKDQPQSYWRMLTHHCQGISYDWIKKSNSKYALLASWKERRVIYSNTCYHDLFGQAILEPHVQLKDIAYAIDSNRYKNYHPTYYHRMYE